MIRSLRWALLSSCLALAACSATDTQDDDLPPDPGPAGLTTLVGIDSDNDGIRDDVQRFVMLNHQEPEVRAALIQVAVPLIRSYTVASSDGAVLGFTNELVRGVSCVHTLMPTEDASRAVAELESVVLNTPERIRANEAADERASGDTFLLPDDDAGDPCI